MATIFLCFIFCAQYMLNTDAVTQNYFWRDYSACDLPSDAVEGHDNMYIGQVNYKGNIPAAIYPHRGLAVAEISGTRIIKSNIKILCSPDPSNFYWDPVDFGDPRHHSTNDAVRGGYEEHRDDHLFIGKALYDEEWKLGPVVPVEYNEKGLVIRDKNGYTKTLLEFSLLKYNTTSYLSNRSLSGLINNLDGGVF